MSERASLVVGLGNPGPEYVGTRHNIGFAVAEQLAAAHGGSFKSKTRFGAEVAEISLEGRKVTVAKPQTYMNRSGQAVAALLGWLKLSAADMLVVLDDADLPLGQLRLRQAGGSGGHNGLGSILAALGGEQGFARLRIGIGRSAPVGVDIASHVLGRFAPAEREAAIAAVALATEAVQSCLKEGLTAAMNQFNRKAAPKGGATPPTAK